MFDQGAIISKNEFTFEISRFWFSRGWKVCTWLRANMKVNNKKADKGNTAVVMDTQTKITERNDQVCDINYYTLPQAPIVASMANKV